MNFSSTSYIEQVLTEKFGRKISIETTQPVGGGCINECSAIKTSAGKFFVKQNAASAFQGMFDCESKGLELLNKTVAGFAPEVIARGENKKEDEQWLVLEWIEKGSAKQNFWQDFAQKLVILHRQSNDHFGLDYDNYMGSLYQYNDPLNHWVSFFVLRRIEPQLRKAIDEQKLLKEVLRPFEKLFPKLEDIFPPRKAFAPPW